MPIQNITSFTRKTNTQTNKNKKQKQTNKQKKRNPIFCTTWSRFIDKLLSGKIKRIIFLQVTVLWGFKYLCLFILNKL